MSEASADSFDDVEMSREGMRLLLCNNWKAAEDLFDKYKYASIYLFSEAKASVPGTSNMLGEWVRDFSPRASSATEAVKETKFGTKLA